MIVFYVQTDFRLQKSILNSFWNTITHALRQTLNIVQIMEFVLYVIFHVNFQLKINFCALVNNTLSCTKLI